MTDSFTESTVEEAALSWFDNLGYAVQHGPATAPGEPAAERSDSAQVTLQDRLRPALACLNPSLPPKALEDAFRRLTRPEGATLEAGNRASHRMLVDGVPVEYRFAALRDTLPPKLISGEIRIKDVQRIAGEVR